MYIVADNVQEICYGSQMNLFNLKYMYVEYFFSILISCSVGPGSVTKEKELTEIPLQFLPKAKKGIICVHRLLVSHPNKD